MKQDQLYPKQVLHCLSAFMTFWASWMKDQPKLCSRLQVGKCHFWILTHTGVSTHTIYLNVYVISGTGLASSTVWLVIAFQFFQAKGERDYMKTIIISLEILKYFLRLLSLKKSAMSRVINTVIPTLFSKMPAYK